MSKITLQVKSDTQTRKITVSEIEYSKARGRQAYTHPDCNIFLIGRNSDMVSYNIQLALQDRNMRVSALRFWKNSRMEKSK
jgi:hypothetical protein